MSNSIKLSELCSDISYGYTASADSEEVGPKFLRITDIQGGVVNWEDVPFCKIDSKNLEKNLLRKGDIVVARTGNSTGENYIFDSEYDAVFASYLIRFRVNPELANPYFVWLQMRTQTWCSFVSGSKSGSAQAGANAKVLGLFEVELPERHIQDKIVDIVFDYFNKIELNRQTNQTLEQIAQALFKSWFVDFDPVFDNALSSGLAVNDFPEALQKKALSRQQQRQQVQQSIATGELEAKPLPEDISQLFPSEFEQTDEPSIGINGWIPKGWQTNTLHNMVDTISDTYKLKEVDEVIFLNTGDIENGKFLHNDFSPTEGLPGQAKKSISKGDILYSEIRPKNKRFAFVNFDAKEYVVSTKLMVLRAKEGISSLLPYFILTQDKVVNELQHVAEHRSGTFPQITFKELQKIQMVFPESSELQDYFVEQHLKQIFNKRLASIEQSEQLEKLRDTLLPKLISGELQLPAEIINAEVPA